MADEGFRPLTDDELKEFCKPGRWFPNVLDKRDIAAHQSEPTGESHPMRSRSGATVGASSAPGDAADVRKRTAGELKPIEVDNALLIITRGLYNVKSAICTILNKQKAAQAIWGFDEETLVTSVGDTDGPPPAIAIFEEGYVAFPKEINAACWIAPTGADILIDINHHDAATGTKTSLFDSTQLTVAAGETTGRLKAFRSLRIKRYDLLSIDIDQIGSGTAGGYLEVSMEFILKKLITKTSIVGN